LMTLTLKPKFDSVAAACGVLIPTTLGSSTSCQGHGTVPGGSSLGVVERLAR
jgi:hypothetical protein